MSKCLRCGATLPPVGECPHCAQQAQTPAASSGAVPELLQKDLQLDRRGRPAGATPPGLTPARPAPTRTQASITPAPSQPAPAGGPRPLSPPLPARAQATRPPAIAPMPTPPPQGRPAATPDQFPPAWSPFASAAPAPAAPAALAVTPVEPPRASAAEPAAPARAAPERPARPSIAPPKVSAVTASTGDAALELHARPAPWWRRVIAFTVDALAVGAVLALYLLLATAIAGRPATTTHLTGLDAWVARIHAIEHLVIPGLALAAVLSIAYSAAFGFLWDGRTLGRRLMGIRLVDRSGLAPVPARAILRSVLAIFSFAIFLGGFWLAFFDRKRQTLHDKLTSTYLVQPMR